eukprot:TRINITY_DN2105_c0_g1_i1.p1 TRINITY_DN2105_c0_g1~~TRINITY_DN2105_c0_g1_i1.p1  ORF type:complete len:431 (+),score=48.98 TRINITY_DN2105_c0_g1_i1:65-1294(+)
MIAGIVGSLFVSILHPSDSGRSFRAVQHNATPERLPSNLVFLHGGEMRDVLDVMRDGIPTSVHEELKLGPGLYTSMHHHTNTIWTRGFSGEPWTEHVGTSTTALSSREKLMPYVLFLHLSGKTRFAMLPRSLEYGDATDWSKGRNRQRCLNNFDVLFVMSQKKTSRAIEDRACQSMKWLSRSSAECELAPANVVMNLWHKGCVEEFKINPGRESLTHVSRVAYNNLRSHLENSIRLKPEYPFSEYPLKTKTQIEAVRSWMCPHVLEQQHILSMSAQKQKTFSSFASIRACERALRDWRAGVSRSGQCGPACDEAHGILDSLSSSLTRDLPADNMLRQRLDQNWLLNRKSVRQAKARLLQNAACGHFDEAVEHLKKSQHVCADLQAEAFRPTECHWDSPGNEATLLCSWL